jgi:dipeptidyl aminopeptidase/acylaminoacyl peptidase
VSGRTPRRAGALLLLLAALAGCGDGDEPRADATPTAAATPQETATPAPTATPTAEAEATPEPERDAEAERDPVAKPPAAPGARAVRFRATDGEAVSGQYVPAGRNAPAVVLLHEVRGGPAQWDELVPYLHAAGFATLAYKSRPSQLEAERLPDALGAVRWLRDRPDVDRKRIALVGASIGASTAVLAMATGARETADAAVALSPADSADLWALQDDGRYRPHDVLFVSDDREADSVEILQEGAVHSQAIRSAEAGHGVALLAEDGVRDALLAWLSTRVN